MLRFKFLQIFSFCRINNTIFDSLVIDFKQKPQLCTFGKYLKADNVVDIFNIITMVPVSQEKAFKIVSELQHYCSNDNESTMDVLLNIKKIKAEYFMSRNQLILAAKQYEQIISATSLIEQINLKPLFQLYFNLSQIQMLLKNYNKAQQLLLELEYLISNQSEMELQKAKLYTKMASLISINKDIAKTNIIINKALQFWEIIRQNNHNQVQKYPQYNMALLLKCKMYQALNQRQQAQQYAQKIIGEMNLNNVVGKLYCLNLLITENRKQYRDQLISLLRSQKKIGQEHYSRLLEILKIPMDRYTFQ